MGTGLIAVPSAGSRQIRDLRRSLRCLGLHAWSPVESIRPALLQQHALRRYWPPKQPALAMAAAEGPQQLKLAFGLDPLGDDS